MSNVFIALQMNEETRSIIAAIAEDNPHASINEQPAMVKIDAPHSLSIKRHTVEQKMGRDFDLQELHVHLITLSGHVDETDDEFTLSWSH